MPFNLRSRSFGAATLSVTVFGAAAVTLAAAFPGVAQGAVVAVTSVTCSVTGSNWCISGNNSSSGIGVIGTSKSGTGLRGTSTSQYGLKATSSSNVAIYAQTTSGSNAITALGSSKGNGVNASAGGTGLSGTSTGSGDGVLGYSKSGTGVYGLSSSGAGVYGISSTADGGYFDGGEGDGVEAYGQNVALFAKSSKGEAASLEGTTYGLVASAQIDPLVLEDSHFNVVFQVDASGNVKYKGSLSTLAKTVNGGTTRSFNSNATQPTLEDTGTAQLVRGTAVVRLDPAFAASIEPAAGYRVVVTPNGDTRGLFVTGKTAAGFVVRESQAGRSTVTFDYRIVGTAFGTAGQHMAMLSPAAARALEARPSVPVAAAKLSARLPAPTVEPAMP